MSRFWLSDETNNSTEFFTVGSTLFIEGRGLHPSTLYDFHLLDQAGEEPPTLLARYAADRSGVLAAIPLIPSVGAHVRGGGAKLAPSTSRLADRNRYLIHARPCGITDERGEDLPFTLTLRHKSRRVFACDAEGHPLTGIEKGEGPLMTALRNFPRGGVRVYLVPHQEGWQLGDPIQPVKMRNGRPCSWFFSHDGAARRVVRLAESREIPAGSYQLIARSLSPGWHDAESFLLQDDIVSDRHSASLVVRLPFINPLQDCESLALARPAQPSMTTRPWMKLENHSSMGTEVYAAFDLDSSPAGHSGKGAVIFVIRSRVALAAHAPRALRACEAER
ncbi:hypothetical protein DYQ86_25040 [Acidobacteria bacterium AB60]|nr:hypothetical protein DYQ86_25040 [Acidobacteria bacterium AB60]